MHWMRTPPPALTHDCTPRGRRSRRTLPHPHRMLHRRARAQPAALDAPRPALAGADHRGSHADGSAARAAAHRRRRGGGPGVAGAVVDPAAADRGGGGGGSATPHRSRRGGANGPGVVPGGEGGLLGLAFLPGDGDRPAYVYAYFTAASDNRIVRM